MFSASQKNQKDLSAYFLLFSQSIPWELFLDILYVIMKIGVLREPLKFSYGMGHSHIGFRGAELMLRGLKTQNHLTCITCQSTFLSYNINSIEFSL